MALDDSPSHSNGRDFWVLGRNLPELERRIATLARRAQRLGTGPIAVRDTGERLPMSNEKCRWVITEICRSAWRSG